MCWYDDYGWWGIASAKALLDEYASIFGPVRSEFQDIGRECWNVMQNGKPHKVYKYAGAPNVWVNREEPLREPPTAARFPTGRSPDS